MITFRSSAPVILGALVFLMAGCECAGRRSAAIDSWPSALRARFPKTNRGPHVIVLVSERDPERDERWPAIIVPAGSAALDEQAPLMFLPIRRVGHSRLDRSLDIGACQEPEEEVPEGDIEWPALDPNKSWRSPLDDELSDEELNQELDEAVRRAFEDLPDAAESPTTPDPNNGSEDSPKDERPPLILEDLEWRRILPDDPRPFLWPPNEPWPPKRWGRLPDHLRPREDGWRLGEGWRIYVTPLTDED